MTIRIGVYPPREFAARNALFCALERLFPVKFEAQQIAGEAIGSAVIEFADPDSTVSVSPGAPKLILPVCSPSRSNSASAVLHIGRDERLHPAIRGQVLKEEQLEVAGSGKRKNSNTVFATFGHDPIWYEVEPGPVPVWRSEIPIPDMSEGDRLRESFRVGRCAGLLPLLQFIKRAVATAGWIEPSLRAAFLIDDPNLHSGRYGFLRYRELVEHAQTHEYHVAMATIPLDTWYADKDAARIFARDTEQLSLLMHGNNHTRHELLSFPTDFDAVSHLAQALNRIDRFESRTGLSVSRVMAPPHGVCSERSMIAMMRLGYDAICVSRPFPWLEAPPENATTAGWLPADFVAGGFPVIPRYHLMKPRDELILRAFLDQPVILYGHHEDCLQGLDVLAEAADWVNSLGDVKWCALHEIARTNFAENRQEKKITIRPYTNRFVIPDGRPTDTLEIVLPPIYGASTPKSVRVSDDDIDDIVSEPFTSGIAIDVDSLTTPLTVTIRHGESIDPKTVTEPPRSVWPFLRRLLTESRDRIRPVIGR